MVLRKPRYTKQDLIAGTKHEMEHTKDRRVARKIATDHLKEHPTYYRVLPAAESLMSLQENKPPGKPRKKKHPVRQQASDPMAMMRFVPKIRYPGQ